MAINLNEELFKRTRPQKKLEMINGASNSELLGVTNDTIIRIIKETTTRKSRTLYLSSKNRKGNHWNSWIESIYFYKKSLYLNFYIQLDSTDDYINCSFSEFMRWGEWTGKCVETNYFGDPVYHYTRYSESEKVEVIRGILIEYIETKYKNKLC